MELERGFEDDLREAVMDDVERKLVGEQENAIHQFVETVHENLRSYGQRHGYNVESTIESLGQVETERTENSIEVTVGWESEQMARWEFGTSDHTVDGDPLLVFEFDASEYPYLDEMFPGGTAFLPETNPSGIPEARAIRDAMNTLRRRLA